MSWIKDSEPFEKFCAVAFVFLATLSCLATAQSLTLTLGLEILPPWLTFVFAFILVFMLYALTSYLLVQIVNSLNDKYCAAKNIKLPERRSRFIGSLLGVILLWLVCSMPTNTHSMLHMREAKNVAVAELDNQLQVFNKAVVTDKNSLYNEFYKDSVDMRKYFTKAKDDLDIEVKRVDDHGFGVRARQIVKNVQSHYKNEIEKLKFVFEDPRREGRSMTDYELLDFYKEQFDKLSGQLATEMHENFVVRQNNLDVETAELHKKIARIESTIENLQRRGSGIGDAKDVIDDGYNQQSYREQILDNVEVLKDPDKGHDSENVKQYNIYRIDRMYSVFNVWGDFFGGKLPKEFDMPYWILWSLILDIAAFIFSSISFRGKTKKTKF